MEFIKEIKDLLAKGETEKSIRTFLNNSDIVDKEALNEFLILSAELQQWNKEFLLGLEPPRKTLNRINFAILERVDKIESQKDLETKAQPQDHNFKCIYDSNNNKEINPWTYFNTAGIRKYSDSNKIVKDKNNEKTFQIRAYGEEFVGFEKPINRLKGLVSLEYLAAESSGNNSVNLMFLLLPMKYNSLNQTGYLEVGSTFQDDPNNPFSPYRKRFFIPINHIGDNKWHSITLEFDFTHLEEAFYTLLAPRINEGVDRKGKGLLMFKNIKVWG